MSPDSRPGRHALLELQALLTQIADLRGFMAQVAGSGSEVEWAGTFDWILAPGVATGAMLGLAEWLHRTGGRRGSRPFPQPALVSWHIREVLAGQPLAA